MVTKNSPNKFLTHANEFTVCITGVIVTRSVTLPLLLHGDRGDCIGVGENVSPGSVSALILTDIQDVVAKFGLLMLLVHVVLQFSILVRAPV